jgi:putative SOS response-associated peptidase YedK
MSDGSGEAFTILTTAPGPDIAPIHNRQLVVLDRADWLAWLDLTRSEGELLPTAAGRQPYGRAGSLNIRSAAGRVCLQILPCPKIR